VSLYLRVAYPVALVCLAVGFLLAYLVRCL
jgi:hypothetical protein